MLSEAIEENRAKATKDTNFYKRLPYYFVLEVPASVAIAGVTAFAYPLVLAPESISVTEPFTVQATNTADGGLFLEENGIIQRTIRISGHTGWKPKPFRGEQTVRNLVSKEKRSYGRDIVHEVAAPISGQRHFQFLQDAVFRTYSELKRDPSTAKGTFLYFHNPKDDEHWQVAPQRFSLSRDKSSPLIYRYDIEMLATFRADDPKRDFSPQKDLFDKIKDGVRMVQAAIDNIRSGIADINSLISEIKSFIRNIDAIVNSITGIIDAAGAFLSGTTELIQLPVSTHKAAYNTLKAAIEGLEAQADLLSASSDVFPDSSRNALRRIGDGLNMIASHPELFETPIERTIREALQRAELSVGTSAEALAAAEAAPGPKNFTAARNLGTALSPGDRLRAQAELGAGRSQARYTGAQQRFVEQGDSLPSLAAWHLGDAARWRTIAALNGLRPPYISEHGAPNTLRIGDPILIPTLTPRGLRDASVDGLGLSAEMPIEDQVLFADYALEDVGGGLVDWVVDVEGGATDAKIVRGVANLSQAIATRVATEQGTSLLFPDLGMKRVIGFSLGDGDIDFAKFRVQEAVGADPRLSAVRIRSLNVAATAEQQLIQSPDIIGVELDAEVRGLTRELRIKTEV